MPVVPVLFPPDSLVRRVWPRRWQVFYRGWNVQSRRAWYKRLNSDMFALVSFFEYNVICVADPKTYTEIKIVRAEHFPRDTGLIKRVIAIY